MVDDVFAYHKFQAGEFWANIQETFKVERVPEEIVSHGTHVAGLAMENITQWSLVGFSGDFTNESFIEKMNQFVTKHAARFVNMSFSFGKSRGMFSPPRASFAKFSQMIQQNPATLFFVAAGNSPYSIDRTKEFPASYDFANTVVVGALEASEFEPVPDLSYAKVAEFSSFGEKNVDVFAPGDNVSSALIGHRYGPKSGTSMATPKALNVVARVSEEYPQFTGAELKHALLLSVCIPDLRTPLPCLSGGVQK